MERTKMPRIDRARQFAPFDALKGLQDSLRLKEYQHDRTVKGDLSEEKVAEISNILKNLQKNDIVNLTYFENEHYNLIFGKCKVCFETQTIEIDKKTISFDSIFDISKK